uniref:N-acetylneuraminate pyruvate lyase n=1 Tax=Nothobranchius furzeri TaxID=105023 RepID=A0A8C6MGL9_NOTFU
MAPAAYRKLAGLIAATFTPFTPQGEVNLSVIGPYIDYLSEQQGVKGIFVNGTTGESLSLTVAERKILTEEWCQKAKGRMDHVIVHVGCMSVKDSQDLARHAAQTGADGIAVIAPFFFKPRTAEALREFMKEVASAAPNLPFYYYQIPALTGVNVHVRDVIEGIEKLIPSFRGVKFSGCDLMDFGQCVSYCQADWSVLYGVDELGRDLQQYQNQAKQLFRKLNEQSPTRCTLEAGPVTFHYFIEKGVCYLVLCDAGFSKKHAFAYLEDLQAEFHEQHGKKVPTVSRPYSFIEFDTYIQKTKKSYIDSRARRNLGSINTELQDVQRIMVANIEEVLQRGEALSALDSKASNLSSLSKKYRSDAKYLNTRSTYAKLAAGGVFFIMLIVYVRFWWL